MRLIADHRRGEADTAKHELGLSRGPIITWSKDDDIPEGALERISKAWGKPITDISHPSTAR